MCLNTVNKINHVPGNYGIGYKRAELSDDRKGIMLRDPKKYNANKKYSFGRWHKIPVIPKTIESGCISFIKYPAGFHIFLSAKDAENYPHNYGDIYMVRYRNILAFGTNISSDDSHTVIAAEMYIEKH